MISNDVLYKQVESNINRLVKDNVCAPNPINNICEYIQEGDYYVACNKLPYKSYEHENQGDWIEYGHTLDNYIGGLTNSGFYITGFFEDGFEEESNVTNFIETCFVIKAIKA